MMKQLRTISGGEREGMGEEMTQTLYANMSKKKKNN
jgi:hypothetical protein